MSAPATATPLSEKKTSPAQCQTFEALPHEEIAKLAYAIWQQRGCPNGSAEFDWFLAEAKLLQSVERP